MRMNLKERFQKELKMTKKEKILTIILVGIIVAYGWYQVAYGAKESWFTKGYFIGLGDGKANLRDSNDAGSDLNSADTHVCWKGYDLGFVKGCVGVHSTTGRLSNGTLVPPSDWPYPTCDAYFAAISHK